jgi:hypothetical protein
VSPLSPVRAKVIITLSLFVNGAAAEESTLDDVTAKYPVSSDKLEIVNNKNSSVPNFLVILKWPLMVDVESSIVRK